MANPSTRSRPDQPPPKITGGFVDIDKLKSADGIAAIISYRRGSGILTFALFKEFEQDGSLARTSFIPETMAESYDTMVRLVRARVAEIRGFMDDTRERGQPATLDEVQAFVKAPRKAR